MSIPSVERKSTIVDNSLVISIDSKLRQPELAQQDGELDLRGLFAAMDDVMIVLDRDGTNLKILSTNSSGLAYTPEEIADKSLSDIFSASQVELFLSCNHQALLTGQTQICDYSLLIDNTERWFQAKCSSLTTETVLWVARDITERKLAEAQLTEQKILHEQTSLALQESEARWQFALEGAGDGIWDWNIQTKTVFFSRQWKAILGYAEHEVGNTTSEWDLRVHPDDKAECDALLNKHFAGETAAYQSEHRLRCKDGSYKWILARGKMIEQTADGQPLRVMGTHTDIHERKQAESALQLLIEGTAATTGEDFFPAMVKHITAALNVSYALVSELAGEDLHVLAFSANGELQPTFAFDYANTPCERAWRDGLFYCERFVQKRFPHHLDLVKMGAQSYLGVALRDSHGQPIGNLCILDQRVIPDIERVENLLNVFAARAGAELEREQATTALEQLNRELEDKVTARTAELKSSQTKFQIGRAHV